MDERERAVLIAKYEADCAHGLELDRAALQHEVTFLQSAFILNGAAGTAFITLLGANLREVFSRGSGFALVAIGLWIIGVLVALQASHLANDTQARFARAMRLRASAFALQLLGRNDRVFLGVKADDTPDALHDQARALQSDADKDPEKVLRVGRWSVVCFALGACAATLSVLASEQPAIQ
jgi:hypothetical protein